MRAGRSAPASPAAPRPRSDGRGGLLARHGRAVRHGAGRLTRFALKLEYDGAPFVGWQRQGCEPERGVSIQSVLEAAGARLNGGDPIVSVAAGRTDAGVHAAGQVVHLDLSRPISPVRLRDALNYHLKPHPIVVLAAVEVAPDWSARFSAVGRAYRYRILNRPARAALAAGQAWHQSRPLDADAMAEAARRLLGQHDFTSFRATACQARSPVRTLDRLDVVRDGDIITIHASARSFLHHQVRNMVGTLRLVGQGRWTAEDVAAALCARRRSAAGPTAPAHGLQLVAVDYDDDVFKEAEGRGSF